MPIFQTLAFTHYTLQGHGAESVYGSLMAVLRLSDKRQFFRLWSLLPIPYRGNGEESVFNSLMAVLRLSGKQQFFSLLPLLPIPFRGNGKELVFNSVMAVLRFNIESLFKKIVIELFKMFDINLINLEIMY